MGLCNILNDAIIYVERRTFVLLLCGLFLGRPVLVTHPGFLSPRHFPLEKYLSYLVFDNQLNNYEVKAIATFSVEKGDDVRKVPSIQTIS